MKKSLTMGLLLTCALQALLSSPLTGVGTGVSRTEAKASALKDLTEQVVLSNTYVTMLTNKEDSKGNVSSSFHSSSLETGSFVVMGVTYTEETSKDKDYIIKATIEDSSANKALYLAKAAEAATSVNSLQSLIEQTKDENQKIDLYFSLLEALDDYDFYKGVASKLYAPEALQMTTTVTITRKAAEAYCQSYLKQSTNHMESQIELLKLQLQNQALTKDSKKAIEKQIASSAKELEDMKAKQQKITDDSQAKFQELRLLFNASINEAQQNLDANTVAEDSIEALNSAISTIKTYGSFYEETRINLRDYLNTLYVSAENEKAEKENAIFNKSYKAIEMNGNTPKPEAVAQREKEFENAKEEIKKAFRSTETKIFQEALSQWKTIYFCSENVVNDIVGKTFDISSKSQTYFEASNFDLSNWVWQGRSLLTIGNATYSIDISLPYQAWTDAHKDLKATTGSSYNEKIEAAQMWQDFFEKYPELVTVTIHGEILREDGNLIAKAKSYTIGSSLTGNAIYTEELTLDSIVIQNLATMDFSVSYNGGNLSAIIYDANGLDIPMPEDVIFYGGETVNLPSASDLSKGVYILQGWENSYGVGYKAGATLPEGVYSGVLKALYKTFGSTTSTGSSNYKTPSTNSSSFNNVTASTSSTSSEIIKNLTEKNSSSNTNTSYSYPQYYSSFSGSSYREPSSNYNLGVSMVFHAVNLEEVYPEFNSAVFSGFGAGISFIYRNIFRANANMRFAMGAYRYKGSAEEDIFVSTSFSADCGAQWKGAEGYVYGGLGAVANLDLLETDPAVRVAPLLVLEMVIPMEDILGMPINANLGVTAELTKRIALDAYLGFSYLI